LIFYPSRIPDPGVKKAPLPGSGSATKIKKDGKIRSYGPVGLPAATVTGGNVLNPAGVLHSGQDLLTRYTLLIRLLLHTATTLVPELRRTLAELRSTPTELRRSPAELRRTPILYSVVDTACTIIPKLDTTYQIIPDDTKTRLCQNGSSRGIQCSGSVTFCYGSGSLDLYTGLRIRILLFLADAFKVPTKIRFFSLNFVIEKSQDDLS
jgi:hypothetical protein